MSAYAAIVSARFRVLLQYRTAALAGLTTQVFWGLMRVMIFEAFYRSTSATPPMPMGEVITFVWLGQALLGMLPWNLDPEVRDMVRSGSVGYELTRPLDLYYLWFSRAVALRSAPTLLRALPMIPLALLFFGMRGPASIWAGLAFGVAVMLALLLSAALTNLMSISLLWTISGDGIWLLFAAASSVLSGSMIPIPMFPDWSQPLLLALPFRGIADTPYRIYTGHIGPAEVGPALLHQAVWIIALVVIGRALLARGTRRLVVQGG